MKKVTFISICLLFVASVTQADWEPNYKMHWPQLPDLSPMGMDVDIMNTVLADDFKCIETGPIADIHIWGSFADDMLPAAGPDSLIFRLSIHDNIPACQQEPWSMPGDELWSHVFGPGQYTVRQVADDKVEDWYDPATGLFLNDNHMQAYQYNFYPDNPFIQEYCNIYWLDVAILTPDPDFTFGWKTTMVECVDLRWGDDAVWFSPTAGWLPLTYPIGHEFAGQTLDLAFVITPEPTTICLLGLGGLALLRKKR